jgi:hypothetical protein
MGSHLPVLGRDFDMHTRRFREGPVTMSLRECDRRQSDGQSVSKLVSDTSGSESVTAFHRRGKNYQAIGK